jgi:glycosyltransferase involved in cell wall biosynthesis
MKVLFHIPYPLLGGAEIQIKYLIENFSKDIKPVITYEYEEVADFVKSLKVPFYKTYSPLSLAKTIAEAKPHVLHFYHSNLVHNALSKGLYRPKAYEVVHNRVGFGSDCTTYGKEFTNLVVCVSNDTERYFRSKMPNVDTVVIPNGVDTEKFKPISRPKPTGIWTGGFVGRLEPGNGKGMPQLIDLISGLPVNFEIVGKDFGGYQKYIDQKQIKNITLYPYTSDVTGFYNKWDFFVSRSPAEGFGLSIAEAISCGLPCAVFDCGGICEYIEDGRHALIAQTDKDLKEAIIKIISGNTRLKPQEADFSAKTMAARYENMYKSLGSRVIEVRSPTPKLEKTLKAVNLYGDVWGITPKDWYGVRRALAPLTSGYMAPDYEVINRIKRTPPKMIVFGCYMPHWEEILLAAKRAGVKTVLTWHASYILNEFDHVNREWMYHALKAAKERKFDFVATPHEGLAKTWSSYGIKTDFLPNIITEDILMMPKKEGTHFGILGSGQAWKNMDCQIVAADMFGDNSKIHIQNIKHTQSLDILGIKVDKHPHLHSDEDYYKLMGEMTINMCMSLSEVYSYFVAESLLVGTPILTTPITPVMKGAPKELSVCVTPSYEDPIEILKHLNLIMRNYKEIREAGRAHMIALNTTNKAIVEDVKEKWNKSIGA